MDSLRVSLFLLFLGIGLEYVVGKHDPCVPHPGVGPGGGAELEITACVRKGGKCYDKRCKPECPKDTHYRRYDLCPGEYKYCCLKKKPGRRCCRLYGDPHIETFDGLRYDVQKDGEFTVVYPCSGYPDFNISAFFYFPDGVTRYTLINGFKVTLPSGKTIQVNCPPKWKVKVNGADVALPYEDTECKIFTSGPNIYVYLKNYGILICFNCNVLKIILRDDRWIGKLCGLCGYYNDDIKDDANHVKGHKTTDRCSPKGTPDSQKICRSRIGAIKKKCPDLNVLEFLENCAIDECIGGQKASSYTLDAVEESCSGDAERQLEILNKNGTRF